MSAIKETIIYCDGGRDCPTSEPWDLGDNRSMPAWSQREDYVSAGWRYRGGKDYCPECAKRLFPKASSAESQKGASDA